MSLTIYTSNRMERLVGQLALVLETPLSNPLAAETIVVQSRGMQRWLSMELAQRFGVWANCSYPFPNLFVSELFLKINGGAPSGLFDPGVMLWRIMRLLDQFLDRPEFGELKGYLGGGNIQLKKYQLAGKIADTFDQYTLFRGDLLSCWEKGEGKEWQAILWRALVAECDGEHRGTVQRRFLKQLQTKGIERSKLPQRIALFGISYLPPFHLQVIAAIAEFTEVALFILSPCREYWADLPGKRARLKLADAVEEPDFGNSLLASLGRMGKDFSNLLLEYDETSGGALEFYEAPEKRSLLSGLQNDILTLQEYKQEQLSARTGIAFHSCHGTMREIEVLHDNLLDMFRHDPTLEPRDVLVMTPDIESCSAYVEAVFGSNEDPSHKIPYTVSDRTYKTEGSLTAPLLAILELPGKRFSAPAVMDILSVNAVAARFGLSDDDVGQAEQWLEETMIRWGMDEHDRVKVGAPPYGENSWSAGLERLLLGYAMPEEGDRLFDGILPYDEMEGAQAPLLGRFITFVTSLYSLTSSLERPKTLTAWQGTLQHIFSSFFLVSDEDAKEAAAVSSLLETPGLMQARSGFDQEIGLDIMRAWLAGVLEKEGRGLGFMSGGVTFCSMLPMRSIPFRVIALIGMNDGAFPRRNNKPGFDLISRFPRRGDRSLRDEDRYLFLEALLSAREQLYISYTGQSMADNSPLPPSVLVSELQDYLARRYDPTDSSLVPSLTTIHRLQSFSHAYFDGASGLFSYSRENYEAACRKLGANGLPRNFFPCNLPEPPESMRQVSLHDLLRFYSNPAAFLLRTRLGIHLDHPAEPLQEREPFELNGLDDYSLREKIIELTLLGEGTEQLAAFAKAAGILPPARQGERVFEQAAIKALEMAETVRESIQGAKPLEGLSFDIFLGEFRIHGVLNGIWPERLIRYRCAKLAAKDQVKLWIEHLVLNLLQAEDYPTASRLIMADATIDLAPYADSAACLQQLLENYWEGLQRPLKFFPRSSFAFLKARKISDAERIWNADQQPESENPWFALCFGEQNPLDEEFAAVAEKTFAEYFLHCEKSCT